MKFHHISLRVKDFERSMKFYTELAGLTVTKLITPPDAKVAYLANAAGETEVELVCIPGSQCFEGKGMFLCFATDKLEDVHKKALDGSWNPSDIRHPEPDAKYFYVYDPDGVSVQFREYKI